jgi:hypothetical protein
MALETLKPLIPDDETPASAPLATGTPVAAKGPYALPSGKSPVGVDPSLLENMQKLIAEREAQKGSFLESLKDANAWWSGGAAGPGESLRARQKEREEQEATTFGMKSQIAQYKAQQALAQKTQQDVLGALGGGAPGAPGAGGFGTQIDPAIANQIRDLAQRDPAAAQKLLQDHTKKMAEYTAQARMNPEAYKKNIEVRTPTGFDTVSLMDVLNNPQKYIPTEKGAAQVQAQTGGVTPENIRTVESGGRPDAVSPKGAQGVMQVMPNTQTNPGFGVAPAKDKSPQELERVGRDYYAAMQNKYGHDTLAAIAYNMGPGKTDEWLKAGADFNKLPAETQAYIGKVNLANAMQSRQTPAAAAPTAAAPVASTRAFNQIQPMPEMPKSAPLAPPEFKDTFPVVAGEEKQAVAMPAPVPAPAPAPVAAPRQPITPVSEKTMPQLRAEQKASEELQSGIAKGQAENIVKSEAEFRSSTDSKSVAERRASAERVVQLVEQNPKAVGVIAKPGVMNALATIARDGLNTPSGAVGIKTIEDALLLSMPGATQQMVNARKEIAQNLARGALEASKLSQGQGSVSDFERSMFEKIAGSLADTPELLIKRQKMLIARADLDKQLGGMYRTSKVPGKPTDYESFTTRPDVVKLIDAYEENLRKILGTDIVLNKSAATAHPGMSLLNKYPAKAK